MRHQKIIIYQIFTRLFGNRSTTCKENGTVAENGCGKMNFFTHDVLSAIKEKGVTHIWYTGLLRHASTTDYSSYGIPCQHPSIVKGKAGSPYAITDYYDIDPDLADNVDRRMEEFHRLVRATHEEGMRVIMDFVPNHVARQYHSIAKPEGVRDLGEDDDTNMGFSPKNDFYYCVGEAFQPYIDLSKGAATPYKEFPAKATGNDHFDCRPGGNDWYETVKINYGIDYCDAGGRSTHFSPTPDAWEKMLDILLFWAAKGIDGFRCDMAEMVPTAFWQWAIAKVTAQYPDILFIAEVYNPAEYRNYVGAGFNYLYDKVGMYDTMRAIVGGHCPTSAITGAWQSVDDINGNMLYFLENHDEQRIASDFFAGDAKRAFPAFVTNILMRQNPFMLYAGQEYGERGMDKEGFSGKDGRTTIFDYWTVGSLHRAFVEGKSTKEEAALAKRYAAIMNIATSEKAVGDGAFFDLMYVNQHLAEKQYAFLRKADKELLMVVTNFSDVKAHCDIIIPEHAFDFLRMPYGKAKAKDLLSGKTRTIDFDSTRGVSVEVEKFGCTILKTVFK